MDTDDESYHISKYFRPQAGCSSSRWTDHKAVGTGNQDLRIEISTATIPPSNLKQPKTGITSDPSPPSPATPYQT